MEIRTLKEDMPKLVEYLAFENSDSTVTMVINKEVAVRCQNRNIQKGQTEDMQYKSQLGKTKTVRQRRKQSTGEQSRKLRKSIEN